MNKRIEELSEQADLYARSDNSSMLFENYQKRYTEKFAELIVRECVALAIDEEERFASFDPTEYNNLNTIHLANAMDNYQALIIKHFGIDK
jgi:hypothetical protein